ncbi:putative spermidine/putrescine transport system substrate-binding protein [Rhodoligotrophos appendicifer]|uniref:ABC transporter substrate-binding protein n=1 Tax=Rhodoligotrophos appendicifer TaxID=987056 RepID=UPI001187054C|nr:ABC transporter substrate-binding protein [Rhodoligotrophos appendicifer]
MLRSGILSRASRRAVLLVAGAALLATPALAEDQITIASWGGNYQEALSKAVWQPTAEKLGIKILEDSTNGLADVRAQVSSGSVLWDITELTIDGCAQGQTEGLFEDLDYSVINKDGFDPAVVQKTYIGLNYYSNVIGWNKDKFKDGPQSWADFWDVEKFPGRRSLRNDPAEVLEAALLADGVAPDQLYPLDLDRAFKSLEKIKPHISVWWSSGAQSAQLVADGEVDLIGAWNGRISAAVKSGAPFDFTFNQGLLIADCLVIPKGVKNKDLAMKALATAVSADILANLPQYIDYGPANLKAYDTGKITPEMAKSLNTSPENAKKQAVVRGDWWGENGAAARERWATFINQ